MKKLCILFFIGIQCALLACSPVKNSVTSQYKLEAFSKERLSQQFTNHSILVTAPEAAAGYQTEQMLYIQKPFELSAFAQNTWIDSPAKMLLPLLVQSLQSTHYFYAVTSNLNSEKTDYRLDTQLIALQQNFLQNPSVLEFVLNVILTNTNDNRIIASGLLGQHVTCPMDTPYGGVIAANQATKLLTREITAFIVKSVKHEASDSKLAKKNVQ